MEHWKYIKEYKVSRDGVVIGKTGKVLTPFIRSGYYSVKVNGKYVSVHSLVAEAFLGHIRDGRYSTGIVNHINEDKLDNRVENLEVISQRENTIKYKNKRRSNGLPHNVYTQRDKYQVRIQYGGRADNCELTLGTYKTINEAVENRDLIISEIEKIASRLTIL
jgi:hypothetical protein